MNQNCRVCGEVAAGYHFGAFTCEGCKSFFGRTYNNRSSIGECKNNNSCVINKKNRTSCKSCRLKKCFAVGMSKSGSRYGRRSNWFKIHCLLQDQGNMQLQQQHQQQLHQQQQQQQQAHPTSDNGIPSIATQTNNSISNTISQQPMSPLALTTAHHHHHHPQPQQHQPSHQQLQQQLSQQHEQQLQEQPPHQPSQQQLQLYNHLLHHSADAAAAHQFHQLSQLNQLSEMFPMLQSVILTAAIMQAAQQQRPS